MRWRSAAIKFVPVAISYDEAMANAASVKANSASTPNVTLPRWRGHLVSSDPELRTAWRFLSAYAREA
jgi:hypothetical protein